MPETLPYQIDLNCPIGADVRQNAQEAADRKNARVCDKIRLALPRELSPAQRVEAVRGFMTDLTRDNAVPWYAAFHDTRADAHNPHVHIVVRDRSVETGKRVLNLSDSKRDWAAKGYQSESPSHHVRQKWEQHANDALKRAGHDVRIDRRSLEAQGIDRTPQIHEGVNARKIEAMVQRPVSKTKTTGNGRVINYPDIDQGRTRTEHNAEIIDLNLERVARSPDFGTRVLAQHEKRQAAHDRQLKAWIARRARERTKETRDTKRDYRACETTQRSARAAELSTTRETLNRLYRDRVRVMRARQSEDREALKARQSKLSSRLFAIFDLTGKTRAQRKADRDGLQDAQRDERRSLAQTHRETKERRLRAITERHKTALTAITREKAQALKRLGHKHDAQVQAEQERLQLREADRDAAHKVVMHRTEIIRQQSVAEQAPVQRAADRPGKAVTQTGRAAPAPSHGDPKRVRSPNRKPRVPGAKADRLRKARAAKAALQKQRGQDVLQDDFNPISTPSHDKPTSLETARARRDRIEREMKARNKARRTRDRERGFDRDL